MPPGEFPSSVSSDWSTNGDSAGGGYLPSAFVGQPVGIGQVGDVWIGDSGATSHMTRSADLMCMTLGHPPPTDLGSSWVVGQLRKHNSLGKLAQCFTAGPTTRLPSMMCYLCLTWVSTCFHFM